MYRAFVLLYEIEDRPPDPKVFLRQALGTPIDKEEENLEAENQKIRENILALTEKIEQYQKELEDLRADQ